MGAARCERTSIGTAIARKNGSSTKAGRTMRGGAQQRTGDRKVAELAVLRGPQAITIAAVATNAVHNSVTTRAPKYGSGEYSDVRARRRSPCAHPRRAGQQVDQQADAGEHERLRDRDGHVIADAEQPVNAATKIG